MTLSALVLIYAVGFAAGLYARPTVDALIRELKD